LRRLLILADDLSGAADCANAFANGGLSATVVFEDTGEDIGGDVLAIDCDTRHLTSEQAALRVAEILRRHTLGNSNLTVFKKIDSTLRGNVGAELRAVLEERRLHVRQSQRIVAILAPAFPARGRTTVGGYQMVHGIPLHQTEMWLHNRISGEAYLPAMMEKSGLKTALFPLELIRSGRIQLSAALRRASLEFDVLACDAENDEDLKAIAEGSFPLGNDAIWVGSAGIAYQFPNAARWPAGASPAEQPGPLMAPILFAVGSMSTVSHRQAVRLERGTPVTVLHIQPSTLLRGPSSLAWARVAAGIDNSLKSGHDTLLVLDPSECVDATERRRLANALGLMLAPYAKIVGALVATGGETARAILDGWGVKAFMMLGEIEKGLPYSFARLDGRSLAVLTKAGAFGNDETLVSCWDFLTRFRKRDSDAVGKSS
jgi:4-hydroxythreonine-4-phosphate dehydrogenase